MEITRDVIIDLLPMYIANEVSENTRSIIEEFLESDPELAKIAKQVAAIKSAKDIPFPLTEDDKLKAYKRAKRAIVLRSIILAGIVFIILVVVVVTVFVFLSSPENSQSGLKELTLPETSYNWVNTLINQCSALDTIFI